MWAGSALGAVLAGTVAADFAIPGAGAWWSEHPNAGQAVSELLLLGLTVPVVEVVVERVLRLSESRPWRPAAAAAASR